MSISQASRVLNIPRRNIGRWLQQETDLKTFKNSRIASVRTRFRVLLNKRLRAKYNLLEANLYEKFVSRRENGLIVNNRWFIKTGKEIAASLNISATDFKASKGWVDRFKNRYDIKLRTPTTVGQKEPDDAKEQALDFFDYFYRFRRRYDGYHITYANLDEVPVWFDMPSSRTYDFCGNRTVKVVTTGHEKLRLTVVLCTLSTGEKVKPMIIFKTPQSIRIANDNYFVTGSKGGSMTCELMEEWRQECWKVRPNYIIDNLPGETTKRKSVLIMDSARCHLADNFFDRLNSFNNTELKIIKGGMTKYLQPADIVYNKPFKSKLRELWNNWFENGEVSLTRNGNRRPAQRQTVVNWIETAFNNIPSEMIKESYERCGIIDEEGSNRYHHRLLQLITSNSDLNNAISDNSYDDDDRTGITDDELEEVNNETNESNENNNLIAGSISDAETEIVEWEDLLEDFN